MIRGGIFFFFLFILLGNEKTIDDTLVLPKLDLRDGTFIFNSEIDLNNFFEKERKHNYLTEEQIAQIKKQSKEYNVNPLETGEIIIMETTHGKITFNLFGDIAPENCLNFKKLANSGFYDGTAFHRIIPDFIIQGGDILSRDNIRNNDGLGNPGWTVKAEFSNKKHTRGTLSMHRIKNDVNSAGSQFFICLSDKEIFDNNYTIIGEIIDGSSVLNRMENLQSESTIAYRMLFKKIPKKENSNSWEKIEYNKEEYYVKIPEGQNKDNYIKILFDRLDNKNRSHVTAKIKKVRVLNPNKEK